MFRQLRSPSPPPTIRRSSPETTGPIGRRTTHATTKWYIPLFGVGLIALAVTSWGDNAWAPPVALVAGLIVLLLLTGGFRVNVTPARVVLRAGLVGLPLLRLASDQLSGAEADTFSPLADFGGYGIRRNADTLAFVLEGTTGVRLTTTAGKNYLIGSSRPKRLASVIRAAFGAEAEG